MEIKLFGRSLFEVKKQKIEYLLGNAQAENKASKFLPDFKKIGSNDSSNQFISFQEVISSAPANQITQQVAAADKKSEDTKPDPLTPKAVFELKLLHDEAFKLNTDPSYVDQQLSDFKDKLALLKSEEYDMRRGVEEIGSILIRMENRKKYPDFKDFYEEYPYTTSSKIDAVVKTHDYLQLGQVAQFIADMPKEAVEIMKGYNAHTMELCEKQAVFYIVADKKDFKNTTSRRDPILLAQSPFGHFWQILGAWDKEMMFVEEL